MKGKSEYNIYEVEVDPRSKPDDQFGGDKEIVRTYKYIGLALRKAKSLSSMKTQCTNGKPLHEIWVEEVEDNEVAEQWAFKKGKQVFNIKPN